MIRIYSENVNGSKLILPVIFEDHLFVIDGWYQVYLTHFRQYTGTVYLEADFPFKDGLKEWSVLELREHAQNNNNINIEPNCFEQMEKILQDLEKMIIN